MNRVGLLCLFIGLLAITCANAGRPQKPGGGGKCKDKYDEDKCIEMMEAGKCEDEKVAKKCMKTCEKCEDGDSGEGGKCKDKYNEDKCIKMMEAGKCEDKKVAKKCMKTCEKCEDDDGGEGGKCKDKMDKKKCKKIMEAGKCEDEKMAKKCMKTCDMCEDMGPKKTPFELIDENGDGNITRDEWQMKIEKAMRKVMHITNVTLDEDLYDDIWEAMDCDNATTIDMEVWEMLLDGENQCGDELDSWFHFAFNTVVSVIQIVCSKDKGYPYRGYP